MGHEHCGKAAASPYVLDELLHLDARKRVQRSQWFVQKQQNPFLFKQCVGVITAVTRDTLP
jgi:hypothetical protein